MIRLKNWLHYLKMPPTVCPTLPETWLAGAKFSSWWLGSLAVGLFSFLLLLIAVELDRLQSWLILGPGWHTLLYPVMITFLLLVQPLIRHLLCASINIFEPLLPSTERGDDLLSRANTLERRWEWLAFGAGAGIGWLLTSPWDFPGFWLKLYSCLAGGINFGLLGWFVYNTTAGTHYLTTLHQQIQRLDLQPGFTTAFARWIFVVAVVLLAAFSLGVLSAPFKDHLTPENLVLYSTLVAGVVLLFLRSGTASLLSQFRILRAFVLLILVAMLGTLGYHRLEGWALLDGLYMTIITMTTIGYGETGPLSRMGQIFTIVLGLTSVGIAGYTISAIAAFIVEGDFQQILHRQKMSKQIDKLHDHVILCGTGRVGMQTAIEFHKTRTPFVVIDQDGSALEELGRMGDIPHIMGDATQDEILYLAGIERAKGLVTALSDDKDNAFVALSARSINPNLRIVTRLVVEDNADKLRKVGADEIVSTNIIGGLRMASLMIRPSVVTFLDEMLRVTGQTLRMEELTVTEGDWLSGKTLIEADIGRRTGLLVVAVKSHDHGYRFNPRGQTTLEPDDVLIVIGTPEQLVTLRQLEAM